MLLRYYLDHKYELLIALGVLLALGVMVRIVIGNPNGARHRARFLRWRIRLYLRPGPGYANLLELAVRWSRLRAVWTGRRARPSLPWWERLVLPVTGYAVRLGRAHFGQAGPGQHGRPDPGARRAADRQVRVAGRPDHRPPRRRGDHHHPHRPVRQHRRAYAAGTACCTCSTPRESAACPPPSGGTR